MRPIARVFNRVDTRAENEPGDACRFGTEYTDLAQLMERLKYPLDGWAVQLGRSITAPNVRVPYPFTVTFLLWCACCGVHTQALLGRCFVGILVLLCALTVALMSWHVAARAGVVSWRLEYRGRYSIDALCGGRTE